MKKLINQTTAFSQLILPDRLHAPIPQRSFTQLISTRIQSSIEISQQNRITFNQLEEARKQSSNPQLREDLFQRDTEENFHTNRQFNTEESNDLENEQLFFDNLSFVENKIDQ